MDAETEAVQAYASKQASSLETLEVLLARH